MENQNKSCLRKDSTVTKLDVEFGSLRLEDETKPVYANSLTESEMESLIAICDTLISSIDGSEIEHVDDGVAGYYSASASQTGTPDRVARLLSERVNHPKKWILRAGLWSLSTWIGSLVLCGRRSFTGDFPYFRRFCRLPEKQREETLLNWASSYFSLLRMFFRSIKLITALVFFTQVDDKGKNVAWKAIGYNVLSSNHSAHEEELNEKKKKKPEEIFGPLYNGIIDLRNPREAVAKKLSGEGFTVSTQKKNKNGSSISEPEMTIQCDAVVVGSGSGGGVVAGVLAKAGYKVLVVEKGNYYARSKLSLLEGQAMDDMYLSGGLLATSDTNVVVLAGSTVGGGSTINWSASIKTPEHVMKEWAEKSELEMFGSDLYREAMDVVCKRMGVQCGFVEEGFNNEILRKGCEELGLPVKDIPRNSPSDHYCGFCCLGCKKGQKQGTSETWLVDLVESGNGLILPGCKAMEVLYECEQGKRKKKKTATGVAFAFGEKIYVVESKVSIVACGALRTPPLLKRSGLKNGHIGRNLCLHPVVMAWGWFPDEETWPEKQKKSYEGGIMTAMSSVVNAETQSTYGETVIQTPSLHPGMFSGIIPWRSSKDFKTRMLKFSRTAHVFALLRDKGTGVINSESCIDYNLQEEDEESLQKGLESVLKIQIAAGAEEIGTHDSEGKSLNVRTTSKVEIDRFVKEESSKELKNLSGQICSAHQMGSCRMGIRREESAVRPTGETWEVEGLFVADTSVFPTALGVNPMVTVQSIAYCIGLNVVDVLKRKK